MKIRNYSYGLYRHFPLAIINDSEVSELSFCTYRIVQNRDIQNRSHHFRPRSHMYHHIHHFRRHIDSCNIQTWCFYYKLKIAVKNWMMERKTIGLVKILSFLVLQTLLSWRMYRSGCPSVLLFPYLISKSSLNTKWNLRFACISFFFFVVFCSWRGGFRFPLD